MDSKGKRIHGFQQKEVKNMDDVFPPPCAKDGITNYGSDFFIQVLEDFFIWAGGCIETLIEKNGTIWTRFVICGSDWRSIWFETEDSFPPRCDLC